MRFFSALLLVLTVLVASFLCDIQPCHAGAEMMTVTDGLGRSVQVPKHPQRVICSGSGCLRLLTYLQAQDRIVGVDSIEKRVTRFDSRPYALANPQFKKYPLFGQFRGADNPELVAGLNPQPQVIFKTYGSGGFDPVELQEKTGIPVVVLQYGNLTWGRDDLFGSLRLMGQILGTEKRAEAVVDFMQSAIDDLQKRTKNVPESAKKTCYVGGIAMRGPHGFQSTEPGYPPFEFTNAKNVASDSSRKKQLRHADVAKEKLLEWDPEVLFVDLSTTQIESDGCAFTELRTDPVYQGLSAVQAGRVYTVLPYNWYTQNFGSILADAYFVGTLLYPEQFKDVDPVTKADEIYTFLVGKPVFAAMNKVFGLPAFQAAPLK